MLLEAQARTCFSSTYLLKLNCRPHGVLERRWGSQIADIRLTGRRKLHWTRTSWLVGHFEITDSSSGEVLGEANRDGLLSATLSLHLSTGPAFLISAGFFSSARLLVQDGDIKARLDWIGGGACGWCALAYRPLAESDLLLAGLIFHTNFGA